MTTATEQGALSTPPYIQHLAERVRSAIGELVWLPDKQVVEDIIGEALFQAAQDARRGQEIDLEYIGKIHLRHPGNGQPQVNFTPDDWLQMATTQPHLEVLKHEPGA